METDRSICSLVTEEDHFYLVQTPNPAIFKSSTLTTAHCLQPAINLGSCCHAYPCTFIISLNESIRWTYNKGIYDLSLMSVTQSHFFCQIQTICRNLQKTLQWVKQDTDIIRIVWKWYQTLNRGSVWSCFLVAGSSFKSHHRSKFDMMLHNTRGVFRCQVKLVLSFTWKWFVPMGPNIVHRGGFYHVLWHHGGSHVALCSFVDVLSRLLCDPQILEDFLFVSELVQTASFSPVDPEHIIKVMVSCRYCLQEQEWVKLLWTVLRAVRAV